MRTCQCGGEITSTKISGDRTLLQCKVKSKSGRTIGCGRAEVFTSLIQEQPTSKGVDNGNRKS